MVTASLLDRNILHVTRPSERNRQLNHNLKQRRGSEAAWPLWRAVVAGDGGGGGAAGVGRELAVAAEVHGGGELQGRAFYRPSEEEGRGAPMAGRTASSAAR